MKRLFVALLIFFCAGFAQAQTFVPQPSAPWIVTLARIKCDTQWYVDVSPWVPANATRFYVQVVLWRTWARSDGYIDVSTVFRLPGHNLTNYLAIATAESARAGGSAVERGGEILIFPNINRGFYWCMDGVTYDAGSDITLSLIGHDEP